MAFNSTQGLSAGGKAKMSLIIDNFKGVDYAGNPLEMSEKRSPDMMNMIPGNNGSLKCRNGYEAVLQTEGRINGVYSLVENKGTHTLIHHGSRMSEWLEHTMYRYIAEAAQELFHYRFSIGEEVFSFEYGKLQAGDVCKYTASDRTLRINDVVCALTEGGTGSELNFECVKYNTVLPTKTGSFAVSFSNPTSTSSKDYLNVSGLPVSASGKPAVYNLLENKLYVEGIAYNIVGSTSMNGTLITLQPEEFQTGRAFVRYTIHPNDFTSQGRILYLIIDDPLNSKEMIRLVYINLNLGDVPDEGIDFKYYLQTNMVFWTVNGIQKSAIGNEFNNDIVSDSLFADSIWFSKDGSYIETEFGNFPENIYYNFKIDNEPYNFSSQPLTAHDEVKFDSVTKSLYLNDIKTFYSAGAVGGEEIAMEEYSHPLVNLDIEVPDKKSTCQQIHNKLFIFTGDTAYVYGEFDVFDSEGGKTGTVYEARTMSREAYVPTIVEMSEPITETGRGSNPSSWTESGGGGGSVVGDINLLTPIVKETFCVFSAGGYDSSVSETTRYRKLLLSRAPVERVIKIEKCDNNGNWTVVDSGAYGVNPTAGIITFNENLETTANSLIKAAPNYRVTYELPMLGNSDSDIIRSAFTAGKKMENYKPADCKASVSFTVPVYRFYLGNKVKNPERIILDLKTETIKGYGKRVYYDSDDNIYYENFNEIHLDIVREATENTFLLPSGRPAYISLGGKKIDAGRLKVYTKVVREGERLYLDISQPFYAQGYSYTSDTGKLYIGMDTATYKVNEVNIRISTTSYAYPDRVNKATVCTKFGYGGNMDRLFVAGYPSMAEYEFWSEIDNPLYFPDLNYACLGDEDTKVMGWSRVNNNQMAIHKNSNGSDPTVYIQSAVLNEDYSVDFPVNEGPAGDGVICQRAFGVLNGEPLALSERGVFATKYVTDVAADVRYAVPRSYYIDPKLKQLDLENAEAVVLDGRYYLACGGYIFIADGNQKYMIGGNKGYEYSYEWYVWDNIPVRVWWTYNGELYFGTADGRICRFVEGMYYDDDKPINCYWNSKPLNFGSPVYYKKVKNVYLTVAPAEWSEVGIDYITDKVNKTVKTQSIHTYEKMPITIPTNYKAKKIEDIQFKVHGHNAEPLEIYALSVLYTMGGKYKG
ncbi:MAG: hypothetical protein ACOX7J_00245 [Bacillota bacterium]|jgi:hypothetical protein